MTNKIKILIGDDTAQYGVSCASSLRSLGFFVITRPKDGLIIFDAIKKRSTWRCNNWRCNVKFRRYWVNKEDGKFII